MTEKVKKEKAPAKPRTTSASAKKSVAKKEAVGKPQTAKTPSREAIAKLAYRYWKERGEQNGQDWQDWLRAERELKSR
jgi:hypothetical protein